MTTPIQNECEYDQQLRAYLDRELNTSTAADVRAHIATCPSCQAQIGFMKAIDSELAAWRGTSEAPIGLRQRIADAVAETKPDGTTASTVKAARPWKTYVLSGAATVCALLVFAAIIFPTFSKPRGIEQAGSSDFSPSMPASAPPMASLRAADKAASPVIAESAGRVAVGNGVAAFTSNEPSPASAPPEPNQPDVYNAIPRQIIYTADVNITVPKLMDGQAELTRLVYRRRGYISQSNVDASKGDVASGSWTVRVPVTQFEAFMADVAKLGKVNSVHRDSQDVTEEYSDLAAHIANKQIEEARLKEYMQHKSSKLSDILELEAQLSRVRGEIEQMQGRQRLLAHQSDLSTITITLTEAAKAAAKPVKPSFLYLVGHSFSGTLADMTSALKDLAIWFAGALPYLAIAAVALAAAYRQWRKAATTEVR